MTQQQRDYIYIILELEQLEVLMYMRMYMFYVSMNQMVFKYIQQLY